MKKNLFKKWVWVLGAILLLANVMLPWIEAFATDSNESTDSLVWDYIYDEASWNLAYGKPALQAYYIANPSEDLWCSDDGDWHPATIADKWDGSYSGCVHNWSWAVNAPWANYPWAVINVPEGWLSGTIVFEYEGKYEWDNAKAPFGQYVSLKKYWIASIPWTFNDESFKIWDSSEFDPSKLKIKFIPAETTTLTMNDDWFYVYDPDSFDSAKTNWKKPLANYYRDYPWEGLWNWSTRWHPSVNARCEFESFWDSHITLSYATWIIQWAWSDGKSWNVVRVDVIENSVGWSWWPYFIDLPMTLRSESQTGKVFELFTDEELTSTANIWAEIKSCEYPGFYNAYSWEVARWWQFPRIAIWFDKDTQLKVVMKYYDDSDENNIIDIFKRLGNWNDTRDWALAEVPVHFPGVTNFDPANLQVLLVGDEWTPVEINRVEYYTVTWKNWNTTLETDSNVSYNAIPSYDWATPTKASDSSYNYTFKWWSTDWTNVVNLENEKVTSNVTYVALFNSTAIVKSTWSTWGGSGGGGGSSYTSKKEETKVQSWTSETIELKWEVSDEKAEAKEVKNDITTSKPAVIISDAAKNKYKEEQIEAYKWAYENGITTINNIDEARLSDPLTRAELAKMMSQYISSVLKKDPIKTDTPDYEDVNDSLGDLADYIVKAYQYQIMGINADGTALKYFNPNGIVTRAEYATVFSRVLYWSVNNLTGDNYYAKHLEALKEAGILTDDNPTMEEVRGWVMLMMYRSVKAPEKVDTETPKEEDNKGEEWTGATVWIANPASTYCVEQWWEVEIKENADWAQYGVCKFKDGTEVEEWEYFRANHKDETSTWAVAETWTVAEATTWAVAETTTWVTASTWSAE